MKKFINKNFLLRSETAQTLYHDFAKEMPIIDYHCHLPPDQIANDINFENLTQVWLYGDHYKWRAMRTNGVDEAYCTGNASDYDKFKKWAETVPYTLRNPLYHWTHLELQRYFNIDDILNAKSAKKIYEEATEMLQTKEFSVRNILRRMNVKVVCTTDDPIDSLNYHQQIKDDAIEVKVLPAFRPDKAMNVDDPANFNAYLSKLAAASNTDISSFNHFLDAIKKRHDFFCFHGLLCVRSWHRTDLCRRLF